MVGESRYLSKNTFERNGDFVTISNPEWDFAATASIRDDYYDELISLTWTRKGDYLYSNKLHTYLHIYVMKKWYGEETYQQMKQGGCVVDHMDNNGHNCRISNLCFLLDNENKAKGMTVDKMSANKSYIALSMYKDFETKLLQMTIVFNYPATAVISGLEKPAVVKLAYFLYDCEYEMVINDARTVLYDYRRNYSFNPEKLHFIDYHIEGLYGKAYSIEDYNQYLEGKHGHAVAYFVKKAPLSGWTVDTKKEYCCFY